MHPSSLTPASPRAGRMELCGLDVVGTRYFESLAIFSPELDPQRLREALVRSLDRYPFLAGQLVQEGKRLFIDFDGPGVQFAYEESQQTCPSRGQGIAQGSVSHLFLTTPSRDTRTLDRRIVGKPLLFVKLTHFADGHYALGTSMSHVVCDGNGATRWFADVSRLYSGEEIVETPEFSRESVLRIADPEAERPSAASAFTSGSLPRTPSLDRYFEPVYSTFALPDELRGTLISLAAKEPDLAISEHDLLHAMLLKSFAHSTMRTLTHVTVALPYDARRIKDLGLATTYVGNAALLRILNLPRARAIDSSFADLAARLAETAKPTAADARLDIGFRQREYAAGRLDDFCNLTAVQAPIGQGTFLISNMARRNGQKQALFENTLLAVDIAMNDRLILRSAWIYGNTGRKDSHRMCVVLPGEQVAQFHAAWEDCVAQVAALSVACKKRALYAH